LIEKLFEMGDGYVSDFSNLSMEEFFKEELNVNIFDDKYNYRSGSKANRLRAFWRIEDNKTVAKSIIKLIEYIEHKILIGDFKKENYPDELIKAAYKIAKKLDNNIIDLNKEVSNLEANIINGNINIVLNNKVFAHVKELLADGHYFHAVEESFKIVREKLREITGKERATEAFREQNYEKIFGHSPQNETERDFFEGVKFLHMAIQFFRNEKVHTPAYKIDKNLAIHYIVLASLAYELIDRGKNNE